MGSVDNVASDRVAKNDYRHHDQKHKNVELSAVQDLSERRQLLLKSKKLQDADKGKNHVDRRQKQKGGVVFSERRDKLEDLLLLIPVQKLHLNRSNLEPEDNYTDTYDQLGVIDSVCEVFSKVLYDNIDHFYDCFEYKNKHAYQEHDHTNEARLLIK
jgi:hypothetical protein